MKKLSFEESKVIMLEMMKEIHTFCLKENIRYSLADGTLIGAVRHKGMIPWDDDIDLLMLREDYERFIATFSSKKFCLQQYDYKYNSWFLITKVVDPSTVVRLNDSGIEPHGIWVTVYPIDNAPSSEEECRRLFQNIKKYQRLFRTRNFYWINKRGILKNLFMFLFHILLLPYPKDYWHKRAEREITKYRYVITNKRGSFVYWMENFYVCSSTAFDEYVDVSFEGETFKMIKGYDEYLRCQYGDYMQLPPLEERIQKHDYTAYYKD